jgi:hypothetical protein
MALVGPTGTGKTATSNILADALADTNWFGGSVYRESGAKFDARKVDYYFGSESPFRYHVSSGKYHVLKLEELQRLPPVAQNAMKDAYDYQLERGWRAIVIATSNDMGALEPAVRDRFGDPLIFDGGAQFARAFCAWIRNVVWPLETTEPIPGDYFLWGLGDDGVFSGRRAMDRMETELLHRKAVLV